MGGNPPEFLYEKKVLSFTVFCFLSVHRILGFSYAPGFPHLSDGSWLSIHI